MNMQNTLSQKKTIKKKKYKLTLGQFSLDLEKRTHIMGILNVTPDSFYDGGKYFDTDKAYERAMQMKDEGADIIDIGGQSARPGANPVSYEEEIDRVMPVIDKLVNKINIPLSIDTFNHKVSEEALKKGVKIVNDITGLKKDPMMASVIAKYDAAAIIMHIKGAPKDMQNNPRYDDLFREIIDYFCESINIAVNAGIPQDKLIIDPGIGFGKTVNHNLWIINNLKEFRILEKPIMIGVSRKSFIGKILNKEPEERIAGTLAACAISIANGANILRVHDVREAVDVSKIIDAIARGYDL